VSSAIVSQIGLFLQHDYLIFWGRRHFASALGTDGNLSTNSTNIIAVCMGHWARKLQVM